MRPANHFHFHFYHTETCPAALLPIPLFRILIACPPRPRSAFGLGSLSSCPLMRWLSTVPALALAPPLKTPDTQTLARPLARSPALTLPRAPARTLADARLLASSQGYVLTDMIANPPDATASTWVSEWQARTPAGRFATPDEVGEFVALLVSEKQGGMGWMTGSDVVIDGGEWGAGEETRPHAS